MPDQPATLRTEVLARATHLLASGSGMTARDLTVALVKSGLAGVDKSLVNSVLSIEGKSRFSYDRATYTYELVNPDAPTAPTAATRTTNESAANRDAVLVASRNLFADGKPRTAKEVATELTRQGMAGVDKALVGSVLMREGKELFSVLGKTVRLR